VTKSSGRKIAGFGQLACRRCAYSKDLSQHVCVACKFQRYVISVCDFISTFLAEDLEMVFDDSASGF
jgi:hypothetical protein